MLMHSSYATLYLMAVVMFALYFRDIRSRNMHDIDLDVYNGSRSDEIMPIEKPYATAMFALSVTVSK